MYLDELGSERELEKGLVRVMGERGGESGFGEELRVIKGKGGYSYGVRVFGLERQGKIMEKSGGKRKRRRWGVEVGRGGRGVG